MNALKKFVKLHPKIGPMLETTSIKIESKHLAFLKEKKINLSETVRNLINELMKDSEVDL